MFIIHRVRTRAHGQSVSRSARVLALWAIFAAFVAGTPAEARLPAATGRFQQEPPQVQPAQLVILVDESGSISPGDLEREREAAATIALGEFAPGSSVAVVGFASDNGSQSPVDVVCPPVTVKTAQDQQSLADCLTKLRKRGKAEGDGTDHYAAMQQAMDYLDDGPPGSATKPKMIFLLTDGKLDVSDSPRYGPDNAGDQRNQAASRGLDDTLRTAVKAGVQVWPLGFGKVDRAQLDRFAAGGFQGTCGPAVPRPAASVAADAAAVSGFLLKAFGTARCAGSGDIQRRKLGAGEAESVTVTVPEIATDGSIVVVKQDARVSVSFLDPHGREVPKSGQLGASSFQDSGANGPVESLRITDPEPGNWTVKLTSLPGLPDIEVSAVVLWQGAVRASLTVDPPAPQRGQRAKVLLTLQTRNRPIRDPAQLTGLTFSVSMTNGVATSQVPMSDSGQNGDDRAGDGVYTGSVVVPDTTDKTAKFVGSVQGIGVSGDTRTVITTLSDGRPGLAAQITFGQATRVEPGRSVSGTVTVDSLLGVRAKVRLQITDPAPGTKASIPGDRTVFEVPATGRADFPFDVVFAADSANGTNGLTVTLVDDANPAKTLANYPLSIQVGYPPPPTPWWLYLGLPGALLVFVAFAAWARARHRRRRVSGLAVFLFQRGRQISDIAAPAGGETRFPFVLRSANGAAPQLTPPAPDDEEVYRLVRDGRRFTLLTPFGERYLLHDGERCEAGDGLELEVRDEGATVLATEREGGQGESEFGAAPRYPDLL
ncbi:vWA domain-containing protein [Amycolatopsis speibonae]|uniref:VWA domain-containing protein n=1 Tax=Amycolatopsis speibonae TaxID=1450224 RepID=A0ABV7P2L3_9PSEU